MFTAIIAVHIVVCILLIVMILVQRGRGGGLVESLSNLDSMFGTKTNSFLSRTTSVLATLFLLTCLSLAIFSSRQGKSLMSRVKPAQEQPSGQAQEEAVPEKTQLPAGQEEEAKAAAEKPQAQEEAVPQAVETPKAGQPQAPSQPQAPQQPATQPQQEEADKAE